MSGEVDFPPGWLRENIRAARASFEMLPEGLKSCAPDRRSPMPADLDLAALDALFAAATPGEWETDSEKTDEGYKTYVMFAPDGSRLFDALNSSATLVQYDYGDDGGSEWDETARRNFALIAALHNAWPALRRRLEIGDAAVEVWRAEERVEQLLMTNVFNMDRYRQAELSAEIDLERLKASAARARLRALREGGNG